MSTRTVGILKSNKQRRSEQIKLIKEKKKKADLEELCNKPSTAADDAFDNNGPSKDGLQLVISRLKRCPRADVDNLTCLVEHCRRPFKEPLILAFHLSYSHIDRSRTIGRDTTCLVCGKVCSSGRTLSLHAHLSHRALSDRHADEMRALSKKLVDCRAAANKERELNWIAKSKSFNYYSDGHFEDEEFISEDEENADEDEVQEDVGIDDDEEEEAEMGDYQVHHVTSFTFGGGGITRIIDLPIIHCEDDSLALGLDSSTTSCENDQLCQVATYHLPENEETTFVNSMTALAPNVEVDPDPDSEPAPDSSYDEVVEFEKGAKIGVGFIVLPPGFSTKITDTSFSDEIPVEKETLTDGEEQMAPEKVSFDDSTCNIQEFFESPINHVPEPLQKLFCQIVAFPQQEQQSQNQPGFLPIVERNVTDWGHVTQIQ